MKEKAVWNEDRTRAVPVAAQWDYETNGPMFDSLETEAVDEYDGDDDD